MAGRGRQRAGPRDARGADRRPLRAGAVVAGPHGCAAPLPGGAEARAPGEERRSIACWRVLRGGILEALEAGWAWNPILLARIRGTWRDPGRPQRAPGGSFGSTSSFQCSTRTWLASSGAAADVAVVEGFEEVVSSLAREGGEPPVVEYEEPGSGEPLHQPGMRAVPPGEGEFVIGRAAIEAVPENRRGGRPGKRRGGATGRNHGRQTGRVYLSDRAVRVERPRLRRAGEGEVDPCLRGCGARKGDDEWRSMDPDLISVDWDRGVRVRGPDRGGSRARVIPRNVHATAPPGQRRALSRGAAFRDVGGSPPYISSITAAMSAASTR